MEKYNGKIGQGQAVHVMTKSVRPSDGHVAYFTECGADHATNRSMLRTKILGNMDLTKVTCKKCQKRVG